MAGWLSRKVCDLTSQCRASRSSIQFEAVNLNKRGHSMLGNIPDIPSTLECLASKGLPLLQRQKYTPASEDGVAALKVGSVHSRTGV